jgi:type IV pilus assembly protein PilN
MIEINLLPGSGKKARKGGAGPKLNLGASLSGLRDRVRDPWLVGAIASAAVGIAVVAVLWVTQGARESKLDEALQKAVQDSTRYSSVLREREMAEAKRDTVVRSLNMIRAIDDDRYIWPHVMDEVGRALPPYTWLVSLSFTGTGQAQSPITTIVAAATDTVGGKRKHKTIATTVLRDTVRVRLVGNTVDIQALTRFMKQLEVSPFFEQVQLAKSERANDNGKEVTQFQLDMLYSRPGPTDVRRVPLAVSVR